RSRRSLRRPPPGGGVPSSRAAPPRAGTPPIDAVQRPPRLAFHLRQLQVLLDGETGDDPPIFGNQRNAAASRLECAQRGDRAPFENDVAAAQPRSSCPGHRPQGGGLAGAVAAEQGEDLSSAHFERDALQDVALAVVGVQVAAAQERRSVRGAHSVAPPRYASRTARSSRIACGAPRAMTRPWCRTVMRWES